MADYEDQNSSEYKDMNQETQAADPNPHSAGNVPQAPDPAQPDQQNPPQNNGQDPYWHNPQNGQPIPPQNNGQDPYWQSPHNGQQVPPQNPGQDPYWQNQQNSGQFPHQNGQPPYWQNQYNNGQPPCWQNQPQRPRREKNSFATISLISGIFALLTLCCFAFPVAIICGVGAVCFAIISKKRPALQRHCSSRNHPWRHRRSSRHRRVLLCADYHKPNERPGKCCCIQRVL